jgi:tetratricopeptide (TPR) repeat protein
MLASLSPGSAAGENASTAITSSSGVKRKRSSTALATLRSPEGNRVAADSSPKRDTKRARLETAEDTSKSDDAANENNEGAICGSSTHETQRTAVEGSVNKKAPNVDSPAEVIGSSGREKLPAASSDAAMESPPQKEVSSKPENSSPEALLACIKTFGDHLRQKFSKTRSLSIIDRKKGLSLLFDAKFMGLSYVSTFRYTDAKPLLQAAADGFRELVGWHSPQSVDCNLELLSCRINLGEAVEAGVWEAAATKAKSMLSADNPRRFRIAFLEGMHRQRKRDHGGAELLFKEAFEGYYACKGDDEFETVEAGVAFATSLFHSYNNKSKVQQAEEVLMAILPTCRKAFPRSMLPQCLTLLGRVLSYQKRHQECETYRREAVELAETTYGADSFHVLSPLQYVASTLLDQGKVEKAEVLLRRVLEGCEKMTSPKASPQRMVACVTDYSKLLADLERYDEVEALLSKHMESFVELAKASGRADQIQIAWNRLGVALSNQEKEDEAEPCYRKCLESISGAGEDTFAGSFNLSVTTNLANCLFKQVKNDDETRGLFQSLLSAYEKQHPADDGYTVASCAYSLATLLDQIGEHGKAEELLNLALESYRVEHDEFTEAIEWGLQKVKEAKEKGEGHIDREAGQPAAPAAEGTVEEKGQTARNEGHDGTANNIYV